jgi:hypothetical protein
MSPDIKRYRDNLRDELNGAALYAALAAAETDPIRRGSPVDLWLPRGRGHVWDWSGAGHDTVTTRKGDRRSESTSVLLFIVVRCICYAAQNGAQSHGAIAEVLQRRNR